jgi:hypothetical protein
MDSPIKEHYVITTSASANGNLYLGIDDNGEPGIYISKLVGGNYQEPEKLSDSINYLNRPLRPFIAPDESYILFDAGESPDPLSQRDIYISYRNPDETWSKAVLLDETVNTTEWEVPVFVSGDYHLIFFGRGTDTYWMDATNILTRIDEHREFGNVPKLSQNYPNPFSGITTINYYLPQPAFVNLGIYDFMNREITTLVDEERSSGNHEVTLVAGNLPDGLYVCILRTENSVLTRKIIFQR